MLFYKKYSTFIVSSRYYTYISFGGMLDARKLHHQLIDVSLILQTIKKLWQLWWINVSTGYRLDIMATQRFAKNSSVLSLNLMTQSVWDNSGYVVMDFSNQDVRSLREQTSKIILLSHDGKLDGRSNIYFGNCKLLH